MLFRLVVLDLLLQGPQAGDLLLLLPPDSFLLSLKLCFSSHLLLGELHHHLVRQLLLSQQLCFLLLVFVVDAFDLSLHLQLLLVPSFQVP